MNNVFNSLKQLRGYYQYLRNRPTVNLYEDSGGRVCAYNPETRQWDWYTFHPTSNRYWQSGSTLKRGRTFKVNP